MTPWCVLANNVFKRGLKKILVLETVICLWKRLEKSLKFVCLKLYEPCLWTDEICRSMVCCSPLETWRPGKNWDPVLDAQVLSQRRNDGWVWCTFLAGLFLVLITKSCLSANLDKETKAFISFVIENVNKDASFFCNGPFFCDTTWKTCHHYSWHFTHIRLRCHFISAKEPGTES